MAGTSNDKLPLREMNEMALEDGLASDPIVVAREVIPGLFTSVVPAAYHWVPIDGMTPERALDCIDGLIRCYSYRLASNPPAHWDNANTCMASIVLGVSRAVMTNEYRLLNRDINAQELTTPLLRVEFPAPTAQNARPAPRYTVLIPSNSEHIAHLTDNVVLTGDEQELVKVVMRSALTIIPLQGHNLIVDDHHYLQDINTKSYKAFRAVERQLWVSSAVKEMVNQNGTLLRDLMWHKAGHPVAVSIKESAATSPTVKLKLIDAKLGSAAPRLPAMEADLRTVDTYLKLAEVVHAVWATMGGSFNVERLRYRFLAVKSMPRGIENLPERVDMGNGVTVDTRSAALSALKDTVTKNAKKFALAFGFYVAMMANDIGDRNAVTLVNAHSLNSLKRNNFGSFFNGLEVYKDYRAMERRKVELGGGHASGFLTHR